MEVWRRGEWRARIQHYYPFSHPSSSVLIPLFQSKSSDWVITRLKTENVLCY